MADALSRKGALLATMKVQVIGFETLPALYCDDKDFGEVWRECEHSVSSKDFHIKQGFLFRGT